MVRSVGTRFAREPARERDRGDRFGGVIVAQVKLSGRAERDRVRTGIVWIASETRRDALPHRPESGAIDTLAVGGAPGVWRRGRLALADEPGGAGAVQINPKTLARVQDIYGRERPRRRRRRPRCGLGREPDRRHALQVRPRARGSVTKTIPVGSAPPTSPSASELCGLCSRKPAHVVRYRPGYPLDRGSGQRRERPDCGRGRCGRGLGRQQPRRDGLADRPGDELRHGTVVVGADPSAVAVVPARSGSPEWFGLAHPDRPEDERRHEAVTFGSRPVRSWRSGGRRMWPPDPVGGSPWRVLRVESDRWVPLRRSGPEPWHQTTLRRCVSSVTGSSRYRRAAGIAGAAARTRSRPRLPKPSADGGRTLSAPSGAALLRRVRGTRLRLPVEHRARPRRRIRSARWHGIVGAAACRPGNPCDLSKESRRRRARTITIHLVHSDP